MLRFRCIKPVTSQFSTMSTPSIRGARIAPCHRIVPHRAAWPVKDAAGIGRGFVVFVSSGTSPDLIGVQHLAGMPLIIAFAQRVSDSCWCRLWIRLITLGFADLTLKFSSRDSSS
jgi:hypothetical protein